MNQDQQTIRKDDIAQQFDGVGDLSTEAPVFTQVTCYTTFRAEYAMINGNLVFHFFANDEVNQLADPWAYWKDRFPNVLSKLATEFFASSYPRVRAAYSGELASWWLRADSFDHLLDPEGFCLRFLEQLDGQLDGAAQ
jgi:hypothetical protein